MKKLLCLALVVAAAGLAARASAADLNTLTPEEKAAGWKLLFDGQSLKGWRGYKKTTPPGPGWKVEDGLLKKVAKVSGGDIITDEQFENFELAWEWRVAVAGNNATDIPEQWLPAACRPGASAP